MAGLALVIVSGIALLYAFFGHLLPGNMGHLYLAPNQIIESLYLLNDGIWGSSIGASATIIYVFILFGALLEKTNMASVFLELACLVTRNAKGGPAKAAIFGSVSGSAAANVYATGTFTIPLMKRVGYRPEFSGAVEAVASSGGLIMPPVMGSIAFVMAEYTGISYLSICKAALLPAVLYYLSLFTMIHFEALRHGLGGTPSDLIPELRINVRLRQQPVGYAVRHRRTRRLDHAVMRHGAGIFLRAHAIAAARIPSAHIAGMRLTVLPFFCIEKFLQLL